MAQLFKNFAKSTLAGSLVSTSTTLTVATGNGSLFPGITAPDYFYLTLQDSTNTEIVKVTGRTGDVMTIVRAQEGTTSPANFASGSIVALRLTAGTVEAAMAHVDDTTAAHAASAIAVTPTGNLAADDVQEALTELQGDVDTLNTTMTDDVSGNLSFVGQIVYSPHNPSTPPAGYLLSAGTGAVATGELGDLIGTKFSVYGGAAATKRLPVVPPLMGRFVFGGLGSVLITPRWGHGMVRLADGRLLVAGGYNGTAAIASTEFGTFTYPEEVSWVAGTSLPVAKNGGTLTLLPDGRVLATGGSNASGVFMNTTYFGTISGNTITWAAGSNLPLALVFHTVSHLQDSGKLVLIGGYDGATHRNEVYVGTISGNTITWSLMSTRVPYGVSGHATVALPEYTEDVLMVMGGSTSGGDTDSVLWMQYVPGSNTIVYDYVTQLPHKLANAAAVYVGNHMIYIGSGSSEVPEYPHLSVGFLGMVGRNDISTILWTRAAPTHIPMAFSQAAAVDSSRVVMVGGLRSGTSTDGNTTISTLLFPWIKE